MPCVIRGMLHRTCHLMLILPVAFHMPPNAIFAVDQHLRKTLCSSIIQESKIWTAVLILILGHSDTWCKHS